MSAYVIVEFTVKDPEMYREKYGPIRWADGQRARRRGSRQQQLGSPARRWLAHFRSTRAVY